MNDRKADLVVYILLFGGIALTAVFIVLAILAGDAERVQANKDICKMLQTEQIEDETKWHAKLGCLAKRGNKWVVR